MRERFPSLDADDVIQETLIELIRVFPVYHYSPAEKGHFHNPVSANAPKRSPREGRNLLRPYREGRAPARPPKTPHGANHCWKSPLGSCCPIRQSTNAPASFLPASPSMARSPTKLPPRSAWSGTPSTR